jgi:hypothetical protein
VGDTRTVTRIHCTVHELGLTSDHVAKVIQTVLLNRETSGVDPHRRTSTGMNNYITTGTRSAKLKCVVDDVRDVHPVCTHVARILCVCCCCIVYDTNCTFLRRGLDIVH